MKKRVMVLSMAILLFSSISFVFAEEQVSNKDVVKICPICDPEEKMMGKDDISYEYEGKTYHFCSQDCLKAFKENPEKFAKKMDEDMNVESHEGHDHKDHSDHKDHDGHDHK